MWRMTPAWRLLLPPFFGLVTLPKLASSAAARPEGYQQRPSADRAEAEYVQLGLLRKLRRSLGRTQPAESEQNSAVRYMSQDCPYTREALEAKREFVQQCLMEAPRRDVLDIGCNTGTFSLLAAECGARVVAIDHVRRPLTRSG
jgi:2-polyprenyl-3-methyl-5-hydroxy-6-metoxy-1,4-benzoquinol methylase